MGGSSFSLTDLHLETVRQFYDNTPVLPNRLSKDYRSLIAHYYNLIIPENSSVIEIGCGTGELIGQIKARRKVGIDLSSVQISTARENLPGVEFHVQAGERLSIEDCFDYIIISDTLNLAADVQLFLERLHSIASADTRLIINFHSNIWRPIISFGQKLGVKTNEPPSNWLATSDIRNLLSLSGWSTINFQSRLVLPIHIFGTEKLANRWIAPILSGLCLTIFSVARSGRSVQRNHGLVSVVIPARNESGNIAAAVARTPKMGAGTEIIFVEGHSTDDTWAEIQRVASAHPELKIKTLRQTGNGKGDAVRMGFAAAEGDILMILDADLTMPPEELPKFHEVLVSGTAEFANGCRLVYPMDQKAMRFLNLCANKSFSIIFSWLLGQPVKDTLCGTKALSRTHYELISTNRAYFGNFDPFGDFDLLFGAAKLNLKIADIPIRYRERTYGTTNIQRWKHGWLLFRMILFASRKIKFV